MINIEENVSLKNYHTFGTDTYCKALVTSDDYNDVDEIYKMYKNEKRVLLLGSGSNVLFVDDFDGVIIRPEFKKLWKYKEDKDFVWLKAESGVIWDDFVDLVCKNNYWGIENLSHIPGTVGAAPVQNIGAYGVEVSNVIEYVDVYSYRKNEFIRISRNACGFKYRNSNFKEFRYDLLITSVAFKLRKKPTPNLEYGELKKVVGNNKYNINSIRNAIINIRKSKLPDVDELKSAGSFFQNPVVDKFLFERIISNYPDIKYHTLAMNVFKLSAAWMIEKCGWKGARRKGAGVYRGHSLILVNHGTATGRDIYNLAIEIKKSVASKFGIELKEEVNLITNRTKLD